MGKMPCLADVGVKQNTEVVKLSVTFDPCGECSNSGVELVVHWHFN